MDKVTKKLLKRAFIAGAEASFYRHEQPDKFKETKDIHPMLKHFFNEFINRLEFEEAEETEEETFQPLTVENLIAKWAPILEEPTNS